MELSWNAAEEQMIAETMTEGFSRIEAIRRLRSSWRIGETTPPMWTEGRAMPKENPRYGQTVEDAMRYPSGAQMQGTFLSVEASTSPVTRLDPKRLQRPASVRQARWRAKKKESVLKTSGVSL
jgi:hypothetical protein